MENNYYDETYQRPPQRNQEYYSSQQPNTFSKQDEQKNYPIGDSKDVDVGHTNININTNNNNNNNNNDYDRSESQHHDTEKQKHIYERRTSSYFQKPASDQKQFLRTNFGYQQTLKEFGDYQDEKGSPKKQQEYTSHTLPPPPPPPRSELNSSAGYTNETSNDTSKDKESSNRNQLFKNKTKHQEIIRKLYDYDNRNDTLTKAKSYLAESPKSHGELIQIFTKNHKINPNKFQDSSLTSPTEEHFQRMLLNSNYDPITLKSMGRRNSRTNFNKSSFIQHMRSEQLAATEHPATYKTGRFIDTIKRPTVHKKPISDIYQKNGYNIKNYPFDAVAPVKNLHKKPIHDNHVEIKYANNKFGQSNKDINNYNYDDCPDDDTGLCNKSSSLSQMKDETSDDKISDNTKEFNRLSKAKGSARSNRSKRSYNTHQSRKLEDMFNVQKSKCDIINVISDGMQKISQSRYDLVSPGRPVLAVTAAEKCSQTRTIHVDCSSNEKSLNESSVSRCNIFEPMLKEYKKYHLHNIKEEALRLERLEHLSNKIEI